MYTAAQVNTNNNNKNQKGFPNTDPDYLASNNLHSTTRAKFSGIAAATSLNRKRPAGRSSDEIFRFRFSALGTMNYIMLNSETDNCRSRKLCIRFIHSEPEKKNTHTPRE